MRQRVLIVLSVLIGVIAGSTMIVPSFANSINTTKPHKLDPRILAVISHLKNDQQGELSTTLQDGMDDVRSFDSSGDEINACIVAPTYVCDADFTVTETGSTFDVTGDVTKKSPPTPGYDQAADTIELMGTPTINTTSTFHIGPLHEGALAAGKRAPLPSATRNDGTLPPGLTFSSFYGKVHAFSITGYLAEALALNMYHVTPDSVPGYEFLYDDATLSMATDNGLRIKHAYTQQTWDTSLAYLASYAPMARINSTSCNQTAVTGSLEVQYAGVGAGVSSTTTRTLCPEGFYPYVPDIGPGGTKTDWDGDDTNVQVGNSFSYPVGYPSIALVASTALFPHYKYATHMDTCWWQGGVDQICTTS